MIISTEKEFLFSYGEKGSYNVICTFSFGGYVFARKNCKYFSMISLAVDRWWEQRNIKNFFFWTFMLLGCWHFLWVNPPFTEMFIHFYTTLIVQIVHTQFGMQHWRLVLPVFITTKSKTWNSYCTWSWRHEDLFRKSCKCLSIKYNE